MTDRKLAWAERTLADPARWPTLAQAQLVELCILSLIRYGVTRDGSLVRHLLPLFTQLCDHHGAAVRMQVFGEVKALLDQGRLHAMALLPFVICDDDQVVVSSATLDLIAYSEPQGPAQQPYGVAELEALAAKRVPRALGFVLGGVVVYGDARLRGTMEAIARQCTDTELADAARCRSGFLTHAAVEFWLSTCEALQRDGVHGEDSRFGVAASALVNLRRAVQHEMVLDLVRHCPAPRFDPPLEAAQRWSLAAYGRLIRPRLQALTAGEARGVGVMPYVMAEWGLRARPR